MDFRALLISLLYHCCKWLVLGSTASVILVVKHRDVASETLEVAKGSDSDPLVMMRTNIG